MSKLAIFNNVTRTAHKIGFQLKKHSPEILAVAGTVGVVASTVMACKATTKLHDILEDSKNQVNQVHEVLENKSIPAEKYSGEDGKKDIAVIYTQTTLKVVKLYAPAVILGALSLTSILTSNNILRKRNVALAAAYTAVDKGFKEYRSNVIERFGKDLDRELRFNVKAKEIEETVVNEKGEEETVKKVVNEATIGKSEYARFYDDGCKGWEKDPEYNLMFLRHVQDYLNDLLRTRGHVFLNEAYDQLGIPRTKAGAIVGWVYNEKNPVGDNYIDFGIYDPKDEKARDFVNGYERVILLDFNVDGPILDLI